MLSETTQDKPGYPASDSTALVPLTLELASTNELPPDDRLVELWLHGRSRHTQRAYRADVERFRRQVAKPLSQVTLGDLQGYADQLEGTGTQSATRHRALSAMKSLFQFGHRLGYLPFNTAAPLKLPPRRETLAERILEESQVRQMLAVETQPRNQAILHLLYAAGLRVSELCGLRWKDLQARSDGSAQVTVFGKGAKTRSVLLSASVNGRLLVLKPEGAAADGAIFLSRRKRAISAAQVLRVVKAAARKAGISSNVVAHTLRHCCVSHSLDHGAPIHLVQQTLGHADLSTTGRYLHARPTDSLSRYLEL